jgi:hypothetical protein
MPFICMNMPTAHLIIRRKRSSLIWLLTVIELFIHWVYWIICRRVCLSIINTVSYNVRMPLHKICFAISDLNVDDNTGAFTIRK